MDPHDSPAVSEDPLVPPASTPSQTITVASDNFKTVPVKCGSATGEVFLDKLKGTPGNKGV